MAEYGMCPEHYIFGLDIGTRSIVGTVGYHEDEKNFCVVAQVVKMHESRSMLDGQIHDIAKVAETIGKVKAELEETIQYKLENVCIAAAGRVLKTVTVRADYDMEEECLVDDERIHSLELLGMEKAYASLKEDMGNDISMYCVGSTVVHYYLDDFIMLNLEGHKGKKISADFLATFLPDEVIASLYSAVEKAGLTVANLTLEPIAASEVAIPVNFRLLNIALVDVGAGTSDISITKDGSIIGYGMIPVAGDTFTEEIAKRYLVDFAGAEEIKMACSDKKRIDYKDVLGIPHKLTAQEVLDGLEDTIKNTTKKIAERIKELNGGIPVSAVFIVGGGGKIPGFAESIAEYLELPKERVAVRGEEVFANVNFQQEDVELDSTLVTPVGICLSYLTKNNNFMMVSVNGRQIKLYDNSKLTVMDAAVQIGFPKEQLFPKRGKEITFLLNNEKRVIRGEAGDGAKITVNGKESYFNTKISADDIIEIEPSTAGKDAESTIGQIAEYKRKGELHITVNEKQIVCPKMVKVNGEIATESTEICQDAEVEILDYYRIEEVMDVMDMQYPSYFFINGKEAGSEDRIYDAFEIECVWPESRALKTEVVEAVDNEEQNSIEINQEEVTAKEIVSESSGLTEAISVSQEQKTEDTQKISFAENSLQEDMQKSKVQEIVPQENDVQASEPQEVQPPEVKGIHNITLTVNDEQIVLQGKENYIFVDILDVYPFDTRVAKGTKIVQAVNGMDATFSSAIHDGDRLELYWEK